MDEYINKKIEFDIGNSFMADELNKQLFTKNDLSSESYYIKVGHTSSDLKSTIERDVKDKFEIESNNLLDNINFENSSDKSFTIYAILYKQFDFKIPFDRVSNDKFGNKEEFAIKLLTNQDDEIFLYTTNENKTFSEYYEILKQKEETYNGEKN